MNYKEFLAYRQDVLSTGSKIIDAADLDLYGKFPSLDATFPDKTGGHIGENIHRCHLVEDFLCVYRLDGSGKNSVEKRYISFSEGVRQSIETLMDFYHDKHWLIASDNYPFYLDTARNKHLDYLIFDTLVDGTKFIQEDTDSDILLLTYPFKPSGASYERTDWENVRSWLAVDSQRRVILDAVYLFELEDENELWSLFHETKQAIILYSLSKAFAAPRIAGFTFSYDNSVREAFKGITRNEKSMRLCYLLLNKVAGKERKKELRDLIEVQYLKAVDLGLVSSGIRKPGYLFYSDFIFNDNKEAQGSEIFAVPATVYGSEISGKIISTLGL